MLEAEDEECVCWNCCALKRPSADTSLLLLHDDDDDKDLVVVAGGGSLTLKSKLGILWRRPRCFFMPEDEEEEQEEDGVSLLG